MTETLEQILEKLKDGFLTIAQAETQINKLFEDQSMRDYYAMAALRATTAEPYKSPAMIACDAFNIADEMMRLRKS